MVNFEFLLKKKNESTILTVKGKTVSQHVRSNGED